MDVEIANRICGACQARGADRPKRYANETIDVICSVTEADLEPLAKHLMQHRIADIEKFKQSIELLRRLREQLNH
jgi:hypothetical protein